MLFLINILRVHPLQDSPLLDARAQNRAEELCRTGQWSHDGWLQSFAGLPFTYAGENISRGFLDASGKPDPVKTVMAWFESGAHRENMLNPHYLVTGLGQSCAITVELFSDSD